MSPSGRGARIARFARVAWLACTLVLLGGCSIVKLTYRSADTLTLHWLDRYADLDGAQEEWAKERIAAFYGWHRATQLPDYVQWLQRTQILLQGPVARADLLALNADISARLDAATMRALPDLAALAVQLRPQQIDAIESKFASNNADFRKEFLDVDGPQRQDKRYQTVLWLAEVLFGRFSPEQEAVIRRASDARPLINELWLDERVGRQRDLLALLRRIQAEQPPLDAVTALLREQVVRATGIADIPDPAARARAESAAAHAAQLAATIVNLTTIDQKQRASDKLQQWADDLKSLSRE